MLDTCHPEAAFTVPERRSAPNNQTNIRDAHHVDGQTSLARLRQDSFQLLENLVGGGIVSEPLQVETTEIATLNPERLQQTVPALVLPAAKTSADLHQILLGWEPPTATGC
eukprot:4462453-Pyramimonas_sp.AAC.1